MKKTLAAACMCAALLAACVHGGDKGVQYEAPAYIQPHITAQIDDLHRCFAEHGLVLQRPRQVEVVPVPAEGIALYPWFTIGQDRVYGVCYGTEIHIATSGQAFSDVVLRHELGHVYQNVNRIGGGVHPPILAPCLPSWTGDRLILIRTFAGDGWTWHADTVESWVDAAAPAPAE